MGRVQLTYKETNEEEIKKNVTGEDYLGHTRKKDLDRTYY